MDTNNVQIISQQVLESTGQDLTGKYVWLFIVGLIALMFKSSIEKLAAALFMFVGKNINRHTILIS
jgi:dsDNA-specific endonuclease/ATPase MutS2